ncbi:acyltransferase [Maribacter stanieri]|uniref:acyltransferase n=1 Tax=Maribacter stanieri TaxID=440514 RepID=UPI0030DAA6FA
MKFLLRYPFHFAINYLPNKIINKIPFYTLRHFYYRYVVKIELGKGSSIHLDTSINRFNIKIGNKSVINRNCYLDGRGGLTIGDNVSISPEVHLITATHDAQSKSFEYSIKPIFIEDYVWVGTRATILPGVTLAKGCVVATGSVVTKDVAPFTIVGGVPAKKIGERNKDLDYHCKWMPPFD